MNPRRNPGRPATLRHPAAAEAAAIFRQAFLLAVLVAVAAIASPLGS